ncbi:FUSC family protein [Neiella sp. HB171785]|uniref:FUSC family protein n=1 Tax=Neiella litorisoli TaxID=2771431 RepID=A0A8J6QQ59_9GAMM|nr:FUSC family protein [Neiella litorisoli]MBD1389136.1 FUSC family protein [Neiella litorisoli]
MTIQSKQAFKVALSLALTIALALSFGWQKPYWGGLAVIVMAVAESYNHAVAKGRHRLIGTAFGVVLAFVWISLFGQQRELFFLSFVCTGALASYSSATSRYSYVFKMTFLVATIVSLIGGLTEQYSFHLAILRGQETLLGVVCFTLVHSILWPSMNRPQQPSDGRTSQFANVAQARREGLIRAAKFVVINCIAWLAWIYLPIPGGFLFPILVASLSNALVEFPASWFNKLMLVVIGWALVVLIQYVFLLPQLTAGWQLALFYFANCFVAWRLFHRPEQLPLRMLGAQMLIMLTMTAQYLRPQYDIIQPLQMLLYMLITMVLIRLVCGAVEQTLESR